MKAKVGTRLVRIQVLLTEAEREAFRQEAEGRGQSLSGWLRERGIEKLEADGETRKITTSASLKKFFEQCRRREKQREPDWKDHLRVMRESRGRGGTPA